VNFERDSVVNGSGFGYNADGEMTNDNGKTLTWAAFGKATAITQGATSVTLAYGPDDDRYEKDVNAYGQSETVLYLGAAELIDLNGSTGIRRTLALADVLSACPQHPAHAVRGDFFRTVSVIAHDFGT
jgi:uncharacterized protein with LGFP repeats